MNTTSALETTALCAKMEFLLNMAARELGLDLRFEAGAPIMRAAKGKRGPRLDIVLDPYLVLNNGKRVGVLLNEDILDKKFTQSVISSAGKLGFEVSNGSSLVRGSIAMPAIWLLVRNREDNLYNIIERRYNIVERDNPVKRARRN